MLPRSCLRLADSKSNSSTRLPRRTTTRVSSGWVASTSILLDIDQSLDGRLAHRSPPDGRRNAARPETGPMVGEMMIVLRARDQRLAGNRARRDRGHSHGLALRGDGAVAANGFGLHAQS